MITWFQCTSDLGRHVWLNIGPTQSVLRIFVRNIVETCLGVPGSGSFRKKWEKTFSSYGNGWLLLTSLKARDWLEHIFGVSASPRSSTKNGYVTLFHCSWGSTWHQACDIRVVIACSIRAWRKLGWYMLEPAPAHISTVDGNIMGVRSSYIYSSDFDISAQTGINRPVSYTHLTLPTIYSV